MPYYNVTSITDPVGWFRWINTLTNDLFGNAIVLAFFVIIMFAMIRQGGGRRDSEKALVVALFLSVILSFMFMVLDFVPTQTVMIITAGFLFSLFMLKKSDGSY